MKRILIFVAVLALHAFGADLPEPGLYAIQFGQRTVLFAEIKGDVLRKAYPKPALELGRLKKVDEDKFRIVAAPTLADPDYFYPLLANVVVALSLSDRELVPLKQLTFEAAGKPALLVRTKGGFSIEPERAGEIAIDWPRLAVKKVPENTVRKVAAFEKALLGKWKYAGEVQGIAGKPPAAKSEIEFCVDGTCIFDMKEKRVFWVDGLVQHLCFLETLDPKDYSSKEEFRIHDLGDELIISRVPALTSPAMERYGEDPKALPTLEKSFRFTRVKQGEGPVSSPE